MLLLAMAGEAVAQTGVKVTYYDGTIQSFNVASSGKLFFASDNLNVLPDAAAATTVIPTSIIRKITFSDSLTTLAATLLNLKVTPNNCSAVVSWQSGSEQNFDHYELQYGTDGAAWDHSLSVAGKGSNSSYSLVLTGLSGQLYYRLKMVDTDGRTTYSNVITAQIYCTQHDELSVYPNPASGTIRIKSASLINTTVRIFNPNGQLVKQVKYSAGESIDISSLPSGVYFMQIDGSSTIKLIKQ